MKDYPSDFDEEEVPDEASSHSINDSEVDFENFFKVIHRIQHS